MITMDLLKGQALPVRSNVKGAAITGVAFSVPVVLLLMILGSYSHDRILVDTQSRVMEKYESKFDNLKARIEREKSLQEKRSKLNLCLAEVGDVLTNQVQWSQILMLVSENLPDSMVVDRLEVKVKQISEIVPKRSHPTRKINVPRSIRTLSISMYSLAQGEGDRAVRIFQQKLMQSESFTAIIKEVVIASRVPDKNGQKDIIRYELNCAFKAH